ncbi:hypothetical protein EGW08_001161, partial [Elysia chlorotica]
VVKNSSVSKTEKVKLFSEVVLRQIAELHQWQGPQSWSPSGDAKQKQTADLSPEAAEDLAQVADVADSLLQELCCSSKHGISFYDKTVGTGARTQNQLLSHFLSWLTKHVEDRRKAALIVNILAANPGLVCGVLSDIQASLEPRWSDSWARRLDWIGSLYKALPDTPPFLGDKESKANNEQKIVTMASVFCLPPPKVTSTLNQSLKHEDIQVRHRYLELVQVLVKKACGIQKALVSWSTEKGYSAENVQSLKDNFTTTVLKSLPSLSQLFICVDKVMAYTSVAGIAGKDAVAAIETNLRVGLGEHTCLLLCVLSLYQGLVPSLLAQRPKDVSKLIQVVVTQRDVQLAGEKHPEERNIANIDQDGESGLDMNAGRVDQAEAADVKEDENLLPQLYLLKLLSETDAKTLALTREGLLEKLLQLVEQNRYTDLTVRLICKMLESMEIFSDHGQELTVWLRNALEVGNRFPGEDGDTDDAGKPTDLSTSLAQVKSAKKRKRSEIPTPTVATVKEDGIKTGRKDLLSFLARCITIIVNNPAPYTDRVMEALTERPVGADGAEGEDEEPMEASSVGTNESVMEAILLMDDEELDELVAATAVKSSSDQAETIAIGACETATAAVNVDLPVSPLVLVALDQLSSAKKGETDAKDYVSRVIIDLAHCVISPVPLVQVVFRSGQSKHLWDSAVLYLRSFLPSQKHHHSETNKLELPSCDAFTSLLLSIRESGNIAGDLQSPKTFCKVQNQIQCEMTQMNKFRRLTGLRQTMLYMAEVVSPASQTPSRNELVHLYRLATEECMELLFKEHKENPEARKAESADSTPVTDKLEGIPSALELWESEACAAAKRILLDPILLDALSTSDPVGDRVMKTSSLKKSPVISDSSIICEILALFRNIFQKSVHFSWFQNETELIQLHLDKSLNLLSWVYENIGSKGKKVTSKIKALSGKGDNDGDKEIAQCCFQILSLLYKKPDLRSVSTLISKLLKLLPLSVEVEKKWMDKSKADTSNPDGLVDLLFLMLDHWADEMAAALMPQGLEVLVNSSNSEMDSTNHASPQLNLSLCASSNSKTVNKTTGERELDGEKSINLFANESLRSNNRAFRLKIVPSFEEACGLSPQHLKPLFDQVFSASSERLMNCAVKLLSKLPQLVHVCRLSAPVSALSSAEKLQASVGTDIAKLLIKSETEIFQRVDGWLQSWRRKPPKHITWWLLRAVLEAQNSFSVDCGKLVEALKIFTLPHIQDALVLAEEDALISLRLICSSSDNESDTSYIETVVTHTAAVIRDRPEKVSTGHYQLLLACAQACPSLTIADTGQSKHGMKTDALILSL